MSGSDMITQQTGPNQVVHQRQDSTHEMEHLFSVSLNKSRPGNSWENKKLPPSFFTPSARSHSRESSMDGSQPIEKQVTGHHRNRSCPVPMEPMHIPPRHVRHNSLDVLDEKTSLEHIPLPPGYEKALTPEGRAYFINHNDRTTTWVDPRKAYLNQLRTPSQPPTLAEVLAGPLPHGWEKAFNAKNEVYFIDHERQATDWFDPRIPKSIQLPGGVLKQEIDPNSFLHQYQQPQPPAQLNIQQRMPSNEALASPHHPRLASGGSGEINPILPQQDPYHQMQMQNMIRHHSMENMDTSQQSPGDPFVGSQNPGGFPSPQNQPVESVPGGFRHIKQASVDSGLGGMNSAFNAQSIPPHLSASTGTLTETASFIDQEMEGVKRQQHLHGQAHHNQLPNHVNNNNNDMEAEPAEDLVPSFPAELNNDIINDALLTTPKMDLTWL